MEQAARGALHCALVYTIVKLHHALCGGLQFPGFPVAECRGDNSRLSLKERKTLTEAISETSRIDLLLQWIDDFAHSGSRKVCRGLDGGVVLLTNGSDGHVHRVIGTRKTSHRESDSQ